MGKLNSSNQSISNSIAPFKSSVKSLVGEVFFSKNSNLLDTIRFYQVTKMVTDSVIVVRELHQMNCYQDNLSHCSPISGRFISEEIEVNLKSNHILKGEDLLGTYLNHSLLTISHGVSVKIWDYITYKNF